MDKIKYYYLIFRSLGIKVILFRIGIIIQKKIGIFRVRFPFSTKINFYIRIEEFRKFDKHFLRSRDQLYVPNCQSNSNLEDKCKKIRADEFQYFSGRYYKLKHDHDWITNPTNDFRYKLSHFSKIQDLSKKQGDIKFVWEISRFSWMYDIIRYDYQEKNDQSNFILNKILNWINLNPINKGPNYICSQEISIRIINWTFALNYYKNSHSLTQEKLNIILTSIEKQTEHVFTNINFSRIAVRNNHALTETLLLYFVGHIYPYFKGSKKYINKGKKWFENEIDFQISSDGSYIQHSMNYHRMVIQLLSIAYAIAHKNEDNFSPIIYEKTKKTLFFLTKHVDEISGKTPNYGSNDGTLLFQLGNSEYQNIKGQLNALSQILLNKIIFNEPNKFQDIYWFGYRPISGNIIGTIKNKKIFKFDRDGYYIYKDKAITLFVRCGDITARSGNNDNLHVDLWIDGQNILRDSGTYKYNTSEKLNNFFRGSISHNTILIGGENQIKRGPRFISLGRSKRIGDVKFDHSSSIISFTGEIETFTHLGKNIRHIRNFNFNTERKKLIIIDQLINKPNLPMVQVWNINPSHLNKIRFESKDQNGVKINPKIEMAYYSYTYGKKEDTKQISFSTESNIIKTTITFKSK